jgi:NAD-dependent dihydropyrimidine dehydrogenase PreA subunit
MFFIDDDKCTGCGVCVGICRQGAIVLQDGVAVIDQALCVKCGDCAEICPEGAVITRAPVYAELDKGGDIVMRGRSWFGGQGWGGGSGFGFRGSSPPWPYVGRGRGGLPRCYYPGLYGGSPAWGATPYSPPAAGQEVDFLKEEASALKKHLEEIEARIEELEG